MTMAAPSPRAALNPIMSEIAGWSVTLRVGLIMMAALVVMGLLAPWIAPYDPYYQDYTATLRPPDVAHWFGTDSTGRDLFSRVLYGIRVDLLVAAIATLVPLGIGLVTGVLSGYRGGWIDAILMRVVELAMAFPFTVLIILIIAMLGPSVYNIYIAVFLVSWTTYARLARAETLVEKRKDYVLAAHVLGIPHRMIIVRHVLPNVVSSSVIFSASDFVLNILLISALSFLGLGFSAPSPEWGALIADGKDFVIGAPWIATIPGFAIVYTGVAASLIGDGLVRRLGVRSKAVL